MALSKRKKKWIFIISIVVILLALIGGNYLKNKYEEHQQVKEAQVVARKYMKEKEHTEVKFTGYEITPMHTLFLYVITDKNSKDIEILMMRNSDGGKLEV